ncbi:hypothetical protein EV193_102363 [Herbihabitans rhizosphaerae]|uniref:Uncharacterized protein n=1 Tax=Herbihabitans rhizosphaerae TaxID=1872711 RepID=A0A4Q7L2L2_9PSEU|nr:hypothetical protein [Herbihabitans rhizosphaerae]RZS43384.1 hypothetical protein EV193_102363 [Herbihabitans rhizosphaerae]
MPDDVRPISAADPGPGSLRSYNGIGFEFKGFTRLDPTGHCFATRWFMIVGLPIMPLERYYVSDGVLAGGAMSGLYNETITRYRIVGVSQLRPAEVLRTYAFGWLTPLAAILPLLLLLARADDLPLWVTFTAVAVWPITAILIAVSALSHYRKNWAPVREVRWRE